MNGLVKRVTTAAGVIAAIGLATLFTLKFGTGGLWRGLERWVFS